LTVSSYLTATSVKGKVYLQGKNPWYPLDRRLGGPQSQFGHAGKEKKITPLSLLRNEPPVVQSIAESLY
jgi:hypothetical protein